MATFRTLILVLSVAVCFVSCAPKAPKTMEESKGQSFVETHNNLLEWLNFFDDYAATSTTPAPPKNAVPEKEIVESIGTVSQPSKPGGTREGQTIKIQVPTLNVPTSQSDSQGQRKPLVKKTKPVDSQGSRNPQTSTPQADSQGSKRMPRPVDSEGSRSPQTLTPQADSQGSKRKPRPVDSEGSRSAQSLTPPTDSQGSERKPRPVDTQGSRSPQTLKPEADFQGSEGGPRPVDSQGTEREPYSYRDGQSYFEPSNQFGQHHSPYDAGFESQYGSGFESQYGSGFESHYGPEFESPYDPAFEYGPYQAPFHRAHPYQYQTHYNPYLPLDPYDDENLMYYFLPQSPVRPSRAPNSLSRTCSNDELENLIGQKMEKLTNTTNLPGFRCHQKDFYQPGRCVESTCAQVRFCGIVGHKIKGRCKGYSGNYDKLCCMP